MTAAVTIPDWVPPVTSPETLKAAAPREQAVIPENAIIPYAYGAVQIKGMPFAVKHQEELRRWTVGYLLCMGQIEAIDQIWINGETPLSGVLTNSYTGTTGQTADALLAAAIGVDYTDTMVFTDEHGTQGLAYVVVEWSDVDHYQGWPTVTVEVRGRQVFDINAATTQYSATPILGMRDFCTDPRLLAATTDDTALGLVQTDNEATVSTEARREFGLIIDAPLTPDKWLDVFATYAGCYWDHTANEFTAISDRPRASVRTLTAADWEETPRGVIADPVKIPTVVRLQYTDTTSDIWRMREVRKELTGVSTGDPPRRETIVRMPAVTRRSQAGREAQEYLDKMQHKVSGPYKVNRKKGNSLVLAVQTSEGMKRVGVELRGENQLILDMDESKTVLKRK